MHPSFARGMAVTALAWVWAWVFVVPVLEELYQRGLDVGIEDEDGVDYTAGTETWDRERQRGHLPIQEPNDQGPIVGDADNDGVREAAVLH